MEAKLDCGDNSCEFAENKTGMRTNGGCSCLKDLDFTRRMAARGYIKALREENARLTKEVADLRRANLGLGKGMSDQNSTIRALTRERDEAQLCYETACRYLAEADTTVLRLEAERDAALVHGPEDMIRALQALTRERDEARAMIAELRTDAGRAAFALANGWPLPEELAAFRREVARLEGLILKVDDLCHERKHPLIVLSAEARRIRALAPEVLP